MKKKVTLTSSKLSHKERKDASKFHISSLQDFVFSFLQGFQFKELFFLMPWIHSKLDCIILVWLFLNLCCRIQRRNLLDSLIPANVRLGRETYETNSLIWSHGERRVDLEQVYFLSAKIKDVKGLQAQMHPRRRKMLGLQEGQVVCWEKCFY